MNDNKFITSLISFVCGIIFMSLMVVFELAFTADDDDSIRYKQGQIDAMTGKIKYHLVVQPDSTKTWEKIK